MSEDSGNNAPENGNGGEENNSSGNAPAFHETVAEEYQGLVQNKGFEDVNSVLKSYSNAEKMLGAPADQIARLPQQGDTEGYRDLMTKLGLPESPDKYEIATSENLPVDENFKSWFANTAHELGLPADTVKQFSGKYNEFIEGAIEADQGQYKAEVATQKEALQAEWGSGYGKEMQFAENAAADLGFTAEEIDALESVIGFDGVMKRMSALGKMMGEDKFVDNGNGGNNGGFNSNMTPAEASSRYADWIADKNNTAALFDKQHVNHKAAVQRKAEYFKLMYPGKD